VIDKKMKITKRTAIGVTLIVLIGLASWGLAGALTEQQYISLGKAEYHRGNYDAAIYLFTKGLEVNPDNQYLYNDRGLCYVEKGDTDKAIAEFSKAIELDPNFAKAYYDRGLAYFEKGSYYNRAPFENATSDLTKAIELEPDNVDAYYNRGLVYNQLFHYLEKPFSPEINETIEKALADFDKVLELDPEYALAHAAKGGALYRYGEFVNATAEFNIALNSTDWILQKSGGNGLAGVYASSARNLKAMEDYNKSIADYEEAIKYNPTLMTALLHQLSNYEYVGEYEKAIEWCDMSEEVMKNDPSKYENYPYRFYPTNYKGKLYYKLGEYEKALEMYDKADELCSQEHYKLSIYTGKGDVYSALGEYDKAIEYYNKTIELAGDEGTSAADAYKGLGIAYKELGEKEKARAALEKAKSLYEEYGVPGHGKKENIEEVEKLLEELEGKGKAAGEALGKAKSLCVEYRVPECPIMGRI
jgi:tetratricopeptide (TPR) repeat protein